MHADQHQINSPLFSLNDFSTRAGGHSCRLASGIWLLIGFGMLSRLHLTNIECGSVK